MTLKLASQLRGHSHMVHIMLAPGSLAPRRPTPGRTTLFLKLIAGELCVAGAVGAAVSRCFFQDAETSCPAHEEVGEYGYYAGDQDGAEDYSCDAAF